MWIDCSNSNDLSCISRKDHLFCISLLILSIYYNRCYVLRLNWFCFVWHNQPFGLFYSQLQLILLQHWTRYIFFKRDSYYRMFLYSLCFFSLTLWLHWWARGLTKRFHGHIFSGKRKLPKLPCFKGCSLLITATAFTKTFFSIELSSVDFFKFNLWHGREPWQVTIYRFRWNLHFWFYLVFLDVFNLLLNQNGCRCWLLL